MKTVNAARVRAAFVLVLAMGSPQLFGQPAPGARDGEEATRRAQRQEKIQQVQRRQGRLRRRHRRAVGGFRSGGRPLGQALHG